MFVLGVFSKILPKIPKPMEIRAWLINTSGLVSSCAFEGIILICTSSSDVDNERSGGCFCVLRMCLQPGCSLAASCWGCQKIPLGFPSSQAPGVHPDLVLCWGKAMEDPKLRLPRGESHFQWMNFPVLSRNVSSGLDGSGYLMVLVFLETSSVEKVPAPSSTSTGDLPIPLLNQSTEQAEILGWGQGREASGRAGVAGILDPSRVWAQRGWDGAPDHRECLLSFSP